MADSGNFARRTPRKALGEGRAWKRSIVLARRGTASVRAQSVPVLVSLNATIVEGHGNQASCDLDLRCARSIVPPKFAVLILRDAAGRCHCSNDRAIRRGINNI